MSEQVPILEPQSLLENPADLVQSSPRGAAPFLERLETQIRLRRAVEARLCARLETLDSKAAELETALRTLDVLQGGIAPDQMLADEVDVRFELCDGVHVRASVDYRSLKTVFLWLGAKTMVEFSLEEAKSLLERNLRLAQKTTKEVRNQLNTIRAEVVTAEVNMSRLYNAEVELRRKGTASMKVEQSS
jgi:prefoldin subunit 5